MRAEGEAIIDELEKHATVKARLSTAPDRAFALRYLKDYDVVHFAGHADYVAAEPGKSGWTLADGKLAADEIVTLGGGRPMPMIVFGNACQSGHTAAWDGDTTAVFGLANAFLTAGVRHYIGTQWEVVDGQSALFAGEFYRHLTDGKAIGAAVRHARAAVVERAGETALAWASYVLYGDPDVRPLHRPEHKGKLSIPSGLKIAARASAPWKRPAADGRARGRRRDTDARRAPAAGVGAGGARRSRRRARRRRRRGVAHASQAGAARGKPTLAGVGGLAAVGGATRRRSERARASSRAACRCELSNDHVAVVRAREADDAAGADQRRATTGRARAPSGSPSARAGSSTATSPAAPRTSSSPRCSTIAPSTPTASALDDPHGRCVQFAAATAARLKPSTDAAAVARAAQTATACFRGGAACGRCSRDAATG